MRPMILRGPLPAAVGGMLTTLLLVVVAAADTELRGIWFAEADPGPDDPQRLYLELRSGERGRFQNGQSISATALQGVSWEQIDKGSGPIQFELSRQPGTTRFEGRFHAGTGSGTWTFELNEAFDEAMRQRGFRAIRLREYQMMALQDVSLAWIDEIENLGLRNLEVDDLLAMSIHGADADFVREMQELGFDSRDIDDWVSMRIHGVDADFVRIMRDRGFESDDADEYVGMRIHKVTPEFLDEMREVGFELSLEEGQSFRIHGVDADFVRELRDMGYDDFTAAELVELRIHGLDARTLRKWNRSRDRSVREE